MAASVKRLDDVDRQLAEDIKARIEEEGISASGALVNSVTSSIDGTHIIIEASPYIDYAVNGRPPGSVPYNFKELLLTWVQTKGINLGNTKPETFAFLTARKIRTEGTRRYRDNNPADITSDPINKAVDTLSVYYVDTIIDNIFRK